MADFALGDQRHNPQDLNTMKQGLQGAFYKAATPPNAAPDVGEILLGAVMSSFTGGMMNMAMTAFQVWDDVRTQKFARNKKDKDYIRLAFLAASTDGMGLPKPYQQKIQDAAVLSKAIVDASRQGIDFEELSVGIQLAPEFLKSVRGTKVGKESERLLTARHLEKQLDLVIGQENKPTPAMVVQNIERPDMKSWMQQFSPPTLQFPGSK